MKKYFLSLFLITTIYACFFIADVSASDLKTAIAINNKVHFMIKYGKGLGGTPNAQEILAYGEGHCGDFSYLMQRELIKARISNRIVGVASSYLNSIHARVEAKINGHWFLFDPTYNIYYPHSLMDLVENPNLFRDMQGTPSASSAYNSREFFKNITHIEYIYNSDGRDKNIAALISNSLNSTTNFISSYTLNKAMDNDDNTFCAANSYKLPQSFTVSFSQPQSFYRIKIKWYSLQISGKSFIVEYLSPTTLKYVTLVNESNYVDASGNNVYEVVLPKPQITSKIRFTLLDAYGQTRMLIREFAIYQ